MDEFARDWTYRTPLVTVEYPAGHRDKLPEHIQSAARKARVLVVPKRTRKKPE